MSTHVNYLDIRIQRHWSPVYFLSGKRAPEPIPPMHVEVQVEFDDNDAALEFERKVREMLEEM